MATIQKTTIRRYNGTEWDPVYLSTSADITALGKEIAVAKTENAFAYAEVLSATDNLNALMARVVGRMATLDTDVLPKLADGSSITALDFDQMTLSGTVPMANLPKNVSGDSIEVADETAKAQLTGDDVRVGDLVKVTGGKVYSVKAVAEDKTVTYMELTDSASDIEWERVKNTPDTLEGYGITDAVNADEKVTEAKAENKGKILVLNNDGKLDVDVTGDAATLEGHDASYFATAAALGNKTVGTEGQEGYQAPSGALGDIEAIEKTLQVGDASTMLKTGLVPVACLPKVALSEMHVVENKAAMASLTTAQVQVGDTVKIADTPESGTPGEAGYQAFKAGEMFFVNSTEKLGTADWEDCFTPYSAGQASAVEWSGVLHTPTTLAGYGITDAVNSSEVVTTATANKILKLDANGKLPADITGDAATLGGHDADYFGTADDVTNLKNGTAITALQFDNYALTGTITRANLPDDISGRTLTVTDTAAMYELTDEQVSIGDLVKLGNGAVYSVINTEKLDGPDGYCLLVDIGATNIQWNKVQNTPTTLEGYGIEDAVNVDTLISDAITNSATEDYSGKVVTVGDDNKIHANIAGDAETLGGKAPALYEIPIVASTDAVTAPVAGQMILVPVAVAGV